MQNSEITGLKARWILPVTGPPIKDSVLFIETVAQNQFGQSGLEQPRSWKSGKIIEIKPAKSLPVRPHASITIKDYGEATVTPGLINLHSHIDYSNLAAPAKNLDFFTWLRALLDSTTHLKG